MTTQFAQQVPFTFLLRLSSDNSYFCLYPREIRRDSDKHLNFYGYSSPNTLDSILPHYSPPTPVNFNQFGSSWCNESLSAYLNSIGLSSVFNTFYYEGVVFQPNGNNQSAAGINDALLVGRLIVNNEIDTDFDNLFSDLISQITASAVSIASQISDTNTNLLSVILNLTNINSGLGNIKSSLDNLNIDIGDVDIQTDDLVTQLQNIYTILASQNSNQAAISSAINNKDNQSDIVQKLEDIFTIDILDSSNHKKYDVFSGHDINYHSYTAANRNIALTYGLCRLANYFSTTNSNINSDISQNLNTKLFANLLALNGYQNDSTGQIPNNVSLNITNSVFKQIRDKISNIETKLEQNLPFTTLAQVDVVTDYTQVVKGVGKNE